MKNPLFFAILLYGLTVATLGIAQEKLTLGDLEAKKAQRLSPSELQSLVPEANVLSIAGTGSERHWKNHKDGTFVASSTNAGQVGVSISVQGNGTWSLAEDRYCVEIDWPGVVERWCRAIYRLGDTYYGVTYLSDTARAYRFQFTK
jgi:hypothetical protein